MTAGHPARREPSPAYYVATVWTTALAAALNMLIILVLLFVVGPKMDHATTASEKNLTAVMANRQNIEAARVELKALAAETAYYRKSIDRLNAAMDANEARIRKAQQDAERAKKAGGGAEEARELIPMPSVAVTGLVEEAAQWVRLALGIRYVIARDEGADR